MIHLKLTHIDRHYSIPFNPSESDIDETDYGAIREYCNSAIKQEIFKRTLPNYYVLKDSHESQLFNDIYKILNGQDDKFFHKVDDCVYLNKLAFINYYRECMDICIVVNENPRAMRKITMKVIQVIRENRGIKDEVCCIC